MIVCRVCVSVCVSAVNNPARLASACNNFRRVPIVYGTMKSWLYSTGNLGSRNDGSLYCKAYILAVARSSVSLENIAGNATSNDRFPFDGQYLCSTLEVYFVY
jgi:hypothetical protein